MPRKTKLIRYRSNVNTGCRSASQSVPCGTFSSSTMIVIRMAMTPSLNASRRVVVMCNYLVCAISDRRPLVSSRVPQRHHFHSIRRVEYVVVQVLFDDRQEDPAHAGQPDVRCKTSDSRL